MTLIANLGACFLIAYAGILAPSERVEDSSPARLGGRICQKRHLVRRGHPMYIRTWSHHSLRVLCRLQYTPPKSVAS
ncbi:hypothetical protein LY78DRAFT_350025 [Colletotrichum sublineola]|nr:hypothetical protein LY78DRAFT_350025 [Colletotrichum sublineola]